MTEREFDETTLWTPANIVTLVRILLVPVFVVAIISPWPTYIPIAILLCMEQVRRNALFASDSYCGREMKARQTILSRLMA